MTNDPKHEARRTDPTSYLESRGFKVVQQGRHYSVRRDSQEIYRITKKPDGTYISCTKTGEGIGDTIALVMDIEGCTFQRALSILAGIKERRPQAQAEAPRYPRLPRTSYVEPGRAYLQGRGILPEVIDHALNTGFLSFAYGTVFFVGRDERGTVRAAWRRGYLEGDPEPKKDLDGSLKYYAPILLGETDTHCWIVEGGADALAIHSLALRAGEPPPTVIVSGGVGTLAFTKSPLVQRIFSASGAICIACDREATDVNQAQSDQKRSKLLEALSAFNPREVWPPNGCKDFAEYNLNQTQKSAQEAATSRTPTPQRKGQ